MKRCIGCGRLHPFSRYAFRNMIMYILLLTMFFYFLKTNKHCQDGIQTGCGGLKDLRVQVVVLQNKLQTVENRLNKVEQNCKGKQSSLVTR